MNKHGNQLVIEHCFS